MTHAARPPEHAAAVTAPSARDALADDALAEEIALYAEVVVAASESEGPLPEGELDRVLGLPGGD
ncbi:hypothetical protein [Kineococcus terrestris]|uniref:hypothetical protein n=1 Tax=Kineococcus terrestris TaxID=2044856 RepID=UPI0034DADF8F